MWEKHFSNTNLDYPNEAVVRFLAKCKKCYPKGVFLDWGCATGRHTTVAYKFGFKIIAADYVEHCVNVTKEKIKKIAGATGEGKFIVNKGIDIEEIEGETLDIILAFGVLFDNTVENQEKMIRNMYRMLKPGGRVFCDFRTERDSVCQKADKKIAENTYILSESTRILNGLCMTVLPLSKLKEMLKRSGFEIENLELYEFTENNQNIQNSWWHITLLKPEK